MVQFDKLDIPPVMETCVLIPEDFSLKIDLNNALPASGSGFERLQTALPTYSFLGGLIPSLFASPFLTDDGLCETERTPRPTNSLAASLENCIRLCATKTLPIRTRYLPFSGTVRTDKLPFLPYLAALDVRHRLGSYDEMVDRNGSSVRFCNWVRFVKYRERLDDHINLIASRNRGSVLFEVIKEIPEGEEIVVFLLPDSNSEDTFSLSALAILRSSIYRRTLDSIISESPLDLSRSLLSSSNSAPLDINAISERSRPSTRMAQDLESHERDGSPPSKRSCLPQTDQTPRPSSFLSNMFNPPSSVIPGYFPFSFAPHPLLNSSPFPLSRLSSITSEGLIQTSKTIVPPKDIINMAPSPSKHSSHHLRINPPPPKRRERTMLPCSECGKAFDRPSLLKRHMRTHTGEKPHVCDVCGKGFSTSSSLNTHRRIHSGEKPHQCGVCGKRFTASSNLYYHKMTHIKEKPHKCSLCTRSFPTPGDLRSHMFVHNGQWPHKCSVCGKGFSKLTNLRNHTLLHSGERQPKRNMSPPLVLENVRDHRFSSPTSSPPPTSSFASSTPSRSSTPPRSTSPNLPSSPNPDSASSSPSPTGNDFTSFAANSTSSSRRSSSVTFHSISSLVRCSSPTRSKSPTSQTEGERVPSSLSNSTSPTHDIASASSEAVPPPPPPSSPLSNCSPYHHSTSLNLSLTNSLASHSSLFPFSSSYLGSPFSHTSAIFTFPPAVVPSILPLLTQSPTLHFPSLSTLPSPPLSPVPSTEKESASERKRTDVQTKADNEVESNSVSQTSSPTVPRISISSALSSSPETTSGEKLPYKRSSSTGEAGLQDRSSNGRSPTTADNNTQSESEVSEMGQSNVAYKNKTSDGPT